MRIRDKVPFSDTVSVPSVGTLHRTSECWCWPDHLATVGFLTCLHHKVSLLLPFAYCPPAGRHCVQTTPEDWELLLSFLGVRRLRNGNYVGFICTRGLTILPINLCIKSFLYISVDFWMLILHCIIIQSQLHFAAHIVLIFLGEMADSRTGTEKSHDKLWASCSARMCTVTNQIPPWKGTSNNTAQGVEEGESQLLQPLWIPGGVSLGKSRELGFILWDDIKMFFFSFFKWVKTICFHWCDCKVLTW